MCVHNGRNRSKPQTIFVKHFVSLVERQILKVLFIFCFARARTTFKSNYEMCSLRCVSGVVSLLAWFSSSEKAISEDTYEKRSKLRPFLLDLNLHVYTTVVCMDCIHYIEKVLRSLVVYYRVLTKVFIFRH